MNCYGHKNKKRQINPREKTTWISSLFFGYTAAIYKKGFTKEFDEQNLYQVLKQCESKACGDKLERRWRHEIRKNGSISVINLLWKQYGFRYSIYGVILLTWSIIRSLTEPSFMSHLISYFKPGQSKTTKNDAIYYGCIVILIHLIHSLVIHNLHLVLQQLTLEIRTAFSSLFYRKCLKLTPDSLKKIGVGNIVTLITKDLYFLELPISYFHDVWIGFVQIVIVCLLLYFKLGVLALPGIMVLLALLILQVFISLNVKKTRIKTDTETDKRIQLTKEALSNIKLVKMQRYENLFKTKINAVRSQEMSYLLKTVFLKYAIIILGTISGSISIFVLIMTQVWFDNSVTPEVVFYILTCFRQMRTVIIRFLPNVIGKLSEFSGVTTRISKLLEAEEMEATTENLSANPGIIMRNVDVNIGHKKVLSRINLRIFSGLTCITGPVGSGKTMLLKTILGEFSSDSKTKIDGQVAYASQTPWIFPSTIKQNILFGEKFNKIKYEKVIQVCALELDLKLLKNGDQTLISDSGKNLSTGQQARINLARAIYREADIYILDDCLSNLDNYVKDKIFYKCIKGFLKDKLCIFVSQHEKHIQCSDTVITIENSEIRFSSSNNENIENLYFDKQFNEEVIQDLNIENLENTSTEKTKLIELKTKLYYERKRKGNVDTRLYWKYIKYGRGPLIFMIIIAIYLASQIAESFSDKLLTKWVDLEQKVLRLQENKNTTYYEVTNLKTNTLIIYSIFLATAVITSIIKVLSLFDLAKVASVRIHNVTLTNILNGVMEFFDTHLLGNILNRFSEDLNIIDEFVPIKLYQVSLIFFAACGSIALTINVNYKFLIPIVTLLVVIFVMRMIYNPTGRSLQRLDSLTRSPIVGQINATFEGLTTIRAHHSQKKLIEEYDNYQDVFSSAHFTLNLSLRGFTFFIDICCLVVIFLILLWFLIFDTDTTAGNVGLALTQFFILSDHLQWGMRNVLEFENLMTSMERIQEYVDVTQEKREGVVKENWPITSSIIYENVNLCYPNCREKATKNICLEINPEEKVGIIGRTGSGKSSFISILFRLYEIEGNILIDNTNIKSINLDLLRKNLDIIPQNPLLFNGTIRENLDPFNQHKDEEIWTVLEKLQIKHLIPDLYQQFSPSTFNSVYKQLICLARIIIKGSKIVILDEFSANMDNEAEDLLLRIVKENFCNVTVLTIAHRLKSVLDCDQVLVFSNGQIVERGRPMDLMGNKSSYFCKLLRQN